MITEIAQIDVKPGMEAEFEAGVKNAAPVFQRAKGCHGLELRRSSRSRAATGCSSNGRRSKSHRRFPRLDRLPGMPEHVAHCFASPPEVEHVNQVLKGL